MQDKTHLCWCPLTPLAILSLTLLLFANALGQTSTVSQDDSDPAPADRGLDVQVEDIRRAAIGAQDQMYLRELVGKLETEQDENVRAVIEHRIGTMWDAIFRRTNVLILGRTRLDGIDVPVVIELPSKYHFVLQQLCIGEYVRLSNPIQLPRHEEFNCLSFRPGGSFFEQQHPDDWAAADPSYQPPWDRADRSLLGKSKLEMSCDETGLASQVPGYGDQLLHVLRLTNRGEKQIDLATFWVLLRDETGYAFVSTSENYTGNPITPYQPLVIKDLKPSETATFTIVVHPRAEARVRSFDVALGRLELSEAE